MYTRPKKPSTSATTDIPKEYMTCEYSRVIRQTDKAILVDFGDLETWLPKSAIILWKDQGKNRISMPESLYKSKNL